MSTVDYFETECAVLLDQDGPLIATPASLVPSHKLSSRLRIEKGPAGGPLFELQFVVPIKTSQQDADVSAADGKETEKPATESGEYVVKFRLPADTAIGVIDAMHETVETMLARRVDARSPFTLLFATLPRPGVAVGYGAPCATDDDEVRGWMTGDGKMEGGVRLREVLARSELTILVPSMAHVLAGRIAGLGRG